MQVLPELEEMELASDESTTEEVPVEMLVPGGEENLCLMLDQQGRLIRAHYSHEDDSEDVIFTPLFLPGLEHQTFVSVRWSYYYSTAECSRSLQAAVLTKDGSLYYVDNQVRFVSKVDWLFSLQDYDNGLWEEENIPEEMISGTCVFFLAHGLLHVYFTKFGLTTTLPWPRDISTTLLLDYWYENVQEAYFDLVLKAMTSTGPVIVRWSTETRLGQRMQVQLLSVVAGEKCEEHYPRTQIAKCMGELECNYASRGWCVVHLGYIFFLLTAPDGQQYFSDNLYAPALDNLANSGWTTITSTRALAGPAISL